MGGKARIDFYGSSELLKKLERAGANVEKCIVDALQKSVEKPKNEMLDFIRTLPFETMHGHHPTGQTEDSFVTELKQEKGQIFLKVGFDIKKGGIAAIFLNYGTPKIAPSFFIDNAVEHNIDEIKRAQIDALNKAFEELL